MNLLRVLNEHSVNHNAAQPPAAAPLSLSLKTQCAASHRSPTPCGPQIKSIPVAVVTVARMLWHAAHHSPLASSTYEACPGPISFANCPSPPGPGSGDHYNRTREQGRGRLFVRPEDRLRPADPLGIILSEKEKVDTLTLDDLRPFDEATAFDPAVHPPQIQPFRVHHHCRAP